MSNPAPYGSKWWFIRGFELRRAALDAEWEVPEGRIGGLVRQQRRRARIATRRGGWLFGLLFVVILLGLGFYLLLPFWKQFVDGQRAALEETINDATGDITRLSREREDLRLDLKDALLGQLVPISAETSDLSSFNVSAFNGHADLGGDSWLLYGTEVPLLRFDGSEGTTEQVPLPDKVSRSVYYYGHADLGADAWLLYGDEGTILRSEDGDRSFDSVRLAEGVSNSVIYNGHADLGGNAWLLYGDEGTVLRSEDGGRSFAPVRFAELEFSGYRGHADLGKDVWLLFSISGTVLRSDDDGRSFAPVDLAEGVSGSVIYSGYAHLGGDTWLLYGDEGTILRSEDGGTSFTPVGPAEGVSKLVVFRGHADLGGGNWLLYGDEGTVLRSEDGGRSFAPVRLDERVSGSSYNGHADLGGDAWLLYGTQGAILRSDDGGEIFAPVPLPNTVPADTVLTGHSDNQRGTWLLYGTNVINGTNGIVLRSDDRFQSVTEIQNVSSTTAFSGSFVTRNGDPVIYGSGGPAIRLTDELSKNVPITHIVPEGLTREGKNEESPAAESSKTEESREAGYDTELLAYIDNLPQYQREANLDRRRDLARIQGERDFQTERLSEAQQTLDELDSFPNSVLIRDAAREEFSTFMTICRGYDPDVPDVQPPLDGVATDPDHVTLACIEGWKAQRATEEQSWWQTLAQQVPPGILLLFLLATLGGLYRYNLRLAGFHNSRADALEILSIGRNDEIRPVTDAELAQLVQMADALAADKVEFGTAKTPADQAVEIARAVVSRS